MENGGSSDAGVRAQLVMEKKYAAVPSAGRVMLVHHQLCCTFIFATLSQVKSYIIFWWCACCKLW